MVTCVHSNGPPGYLPLLLGVEPSSTEIKTEVLFPMTLCCNLYFLRISFPDNSFVLFFLCCGAEHSIKNLKRIKYPNISLELNSYGHRGIFIYHCYSKSIKCPIPLISPFSCSVFSEGLRVINFFNLLLTRFLSLVSEALWCSLNTGDKKKKKLLVNFSFIIITLFKYE